MQNDISSRGDMMQKEGYTSGYNIGKQYNILGEKYYWCFGVQNRLVTSAVPQKNLHLASCL